MHALSRRVVVPLPTLTKAIVPEAQLPPDMCSFSDLPPDAVTVMGIDTGARKGASDVNSAYTYTMTEYLRRREAVPARYKERMASLTGWMKQYAECYLEYPAKRPCEDCLPDRKGQVVTVG